MYLISVKGIEIFAFHGVLPEEKRDGQKFLIDFDIEMATAAFPREDKISLAVDYAPIIEAVLKIGTENRFELLETFAKRVLDYLLSTENVGHASVTVKKVEAPLPVTAESVGITVTGGNGKDGGDQRN